MEKILFNIKSILICFLIFLITFAESCFADPSMVTNPTQELNYTRNLLVPTAPITLTGSEQVYTLYLPIPEQWQLTGMDLHLQIKHSPLLLPNSSLSIILNGTPVDSIKLDQTNTNSTAWDLTLPAQQLTGDWLELKLVAFTTMTNDLCADHDNVGNWVTVSADSNLTYHYQFVASPFSLNKMPYPFVTARALYPDRSYMVLPSSMTIQELIPALRVAAFLGSKSNYPGLDFITPFFDKLTDAQKSQYNIVMVGKKNELPLGKDFIDNTNQGIVMIKPSPWNNNNAELIITGNTDSAVYNAALAFSLPEFGKVAQDSQVYISDTPRIDVANLESLNWNYTTLKNLGYHDQSVLGLGKNTLSYSFNLPNDKTPTGLSIRAKLSHFAVSSHYHSTLSVAVNGVYQKGLMLDSSNESNAIWKVDIPGAALVPGKNTLDFVYDLHVPQEYCARRYNFQAWGVIFADTSLSFKYDDSVPISTLKQFPVPFDLGTLIVLPDQLSRDQAQKLVQFFGKLGAVIGRKMEAYSLMGAVHANIKQFKHHNIILIGSLETNPWIKTALSFSPVSIRGNYYDINTQQVRFDINSATPIGLLELITSPWDSEQKVLLITGSNDESVNWALDLLNNDDMRSQLTGNIATVDSSKTITILDTNQKMLEKDKLRYAKSIFKSYYKLALENYGMTLVFIFLGITIVLAILGFIRRRRHRDVE